MSIDRFPCSCCGLWTLSDPSTASYEICPVCYWESDPVQNEDATYAGGANSISLHQARRSFVESGACSREYLEAVRPPVVGDFPPFVTQLDRTTGGIERGILMLSVLRGMSAGTMGILDGACMIMSVSDDLPLPEAEEHLRFFTGVVSESDDIHVHCNARREWQPEALRATDAQAAAFEERIRPDALARGQQLQDLLKKWWMEHIPS
jgi:hypothetical protein